MKVQSVYIVLVILGSTSLALAEAATPSVALWGTYYDRIDEHLSETIGSDNLAENFAEAGRWLKQLESEKYALMRRGLIKGLRLFVSQETLYNDPKCDMNSHEIIKSNNRAVSDSARKEDIDPTRVSRIVYIIYTTSQKHANSCLSSYQREFNHLLEDPYFVEQLRRVNNFMGDLLKHYERQEKFMLIGPESAQVFYETLKLVAEQDPNRECLMTDKGICKGKAKQMVYDYLVKPCKMFLQFAEHVFVPYKYDRFWIDSDVLQEAEYVNFRRASSQFGLCQRLVNRDSSYVAEDIVAIVRQAANVPAQKSL